MPLSFGVASTTGIAPSRDVKMRHVFAGGLAAACALSLLNPAIIALRIFRCLLLFRMAHFLPWEPFRRLSSAVATAAPTYLCATAAFLLLLVLGSLIGMQHFGGALRGRCVPDEVALARGLLGSSLSSSFVARDSSSWGIASVDSVGTGSASWTKSGNIGGSVELPPMSTLQVCSAAAVTSSAESAVVCPVSTTCVAVPDLLGQSNGSTAGVPSFDRLFPDALAATFAAVAGRWVQPEILLSKATAGGGRADYGIAAVFTGLRFGVSLFGCSVLFVGTSKHLMSRTLTQSMLARTRARMRGHLRRRVLGPQGHRLGNRSCAEIATCLRLSLPHCVYACGDLVRPLRESSVFHTVIVLSTTVYTLLVLSLHHQMDDDTLLVYHGFFFLMNVLFFIEAMLKILSDGLLLYCSSVTNILDLCAAVLATVCESHRGGALVAFGTLRSVRFLLVLKHAGRLMPALDPLRLVPATLYRVVVPISAVLMLLGLCFCAMGFVMTEVFRDDHWFKHQHSAKKINTLLDLLFPGTWGRMFHEKPSVSGVTASSMQKILDFCIFSSWGLLYTILLGLGTACLVDAGERSIADTTPGKLLAEDEASTSDGDYAGKHAVKRSGMIVSATEVWQLLQAYGEDTPHTAVVAFFHRHGEHSSAHPMRLPALLGHLGTDQSIRAAKVTTVLHLRIDRTIIVLCRILVVIDVVVEIWIWLNAMW
eukprot:SAG31_NODE_727_length_12536_cov_2.306022_7_plen_706_part_00